MVHIAPVKIGDQVRREADRAVGVGFRPPDENHSPRGKMPKVDRMAAAHAAHRDRHMFPARLLRYRIPFAQDAQPPAVIATAIGPRRTIVRADREVDAPPGFEQFFRDLGARGTRSDDEDRSVGQLRRIAVTGGAVLIVGSGSSGTQIAEELLEAGRSVYLSIGP